MWNKRSKSSTDKVSQNLNLKRNKKIIILKQGLLMTVIILSATISALAIYKFDWVKINFRHGESVLQVEGGSLNQRDQK